MITNSRTLYTAVTGDLKNRVYQHKHEQGSIRHSEPEQSEGEESPPESCLLSFALQIIRQSWDSSAKPPEWREHSSFVKSWRISDTLLKKHINPIKIDKIWLLQQQYFPSLNFSNQLVVFSLRY